MTFFFIFFMMTSFVLLPVAWILGIIDKATKKADEVSSKNKTLDLILFTVAGPVILFLDIMADGFYFWENNFRTGLNKIVVQHEKSRITNRTLKEVTLVCKQFTESKIKSVSTQQLIKIFRVQFRVLKHL